jgi:hypothetical protein
MLAQDVREAWKQWNSLPEAERRPGAVRVEVRGPVDTKHAEPVPPAGSLPLRLYYRSLAHEPGGGLRLAGPKDFPHTWVTYLFEAQPGDWWLTEAEWKAPVPDQPKVGDRVPFPPAVSNQLFRVFLYPSMAFGAGGPFRQEEVRAGELYGVVKEVTPDAVRLCLRGHALLGKPFDPNLKVELKDGEAVGVGYGPRLWGYLEYDRKKQRFSRFDMVALGEHYGKLWGGYFHLYRSGRQPLGVSFELAKDRPAGRVP